MKHALMASAFLLAWSTAVFASPDLSGGAGLQKALKDARFIACLDGKALYVNRNKALFFRSGSDQRCAK